MDEALFEPVVPDQPVFEESMTPAGTDPVARVLMESALPHLARSFDYAVPSKLSDTAVAGVRVRVKFNGKLATGYVLARTASTEHIGTLSPIEKVVSPLSVLTPETWQLVQDVADRYAGTVTDVLRLAVPPRHGVAEKAVLAEPEFSRPRNFAVAGPETPPPLRQFVTALADWKPGEAAGPRAVCTVLPGANPGTGWLDYALAGALAVMPSGRTSLIIVPDYRELTELARRLDALGVPWARLSADQGPHDRYAGFVRALTGRARIVIGTRAAAFAPSPDLGLVVVFDDANSSLAEPRAPYSHAREVLLTRVAQSGAALLSLDHGRSTEMQRLVENGWCGEIDVPRSARRQLAPQVIIPDPDREDGYYRRIPDVAFAALRNGLGRNPKHPGVPGPVLVTVPRAGYQPVLSCARCRSRASCPECGNPLKRDSEKGPLICASHGHLVASFRCTECGSTKLRSAVVGARRTHEELGRAFPGVRIIASAGDHVLHRIEPGPAIVVATIGSEPLVDGGYRAAVLLDAQTQLNRTGFRAHEFAFGTWMRSAALVVGGAAGGRVVLLADEPGPSGALVRWDPEGYASRLLEERAPLGFPPTGRMAELTGPLADIEDFMKRLAPDETVTVRGPLAEEDPAADGVVTGHAILRFAHRSAHHWTTRLAAVTAERFARGSGGIVHVRVDGTEGL